jgi:Skp family chaperone for outer membrane proteins
MNVQFSVSRIAVVATVLAIAASTFVQNATPATGGTGARSPILIVDKQAIVMGSRLGQDIHKQIVAYVDKMQADLGAQGQALRTERQTLQQQSSSPDHDRKMQALQIKEADFHQKVQARQNLIQGGEMAAQQRYTAELTAVVKSIMRERGADAVVEKSAVFTSVGGLDITKDVIQRLDQKISSFKVPLVNPPASSVIQMQ